MPAIQLEIETYDNLLSYDLLETPSPSPNYQLTLPGGAALSLLDLQIRKGADFPEIIKMVISFAANAADEIAVSLVASWLYDKLRGGKAKTLRINRREVHIEKGQITKIIVEEIQQDNR
jgi:hypothetical protein